MLNINSQRDFCQVFPPPVLFTAKNAEGTEWEKKKTMNDEKKGGEG